MSRLATALLVVGTLLVAPVGPAPEPALVVVVHPTRTESLSVAEVGRIFVRKRRFWSDGAPIIPLNRPVDTIERQLFTARVFGDGSFLAQYWNEQYFAGVFPPTVLTSGAAVRRYVATDRDAIGYLVENEADESVRVILTLGPKK
jgi:hypothetical protein